MEVTPAHHTLKQFRQAVYQTLGHRKDILFELLEAALASPGPTTLVHLSLATPFRRRWPSAPDALADGTLDADRCRRLAWATRVEAPPGDRPAWALDGTVWPRPAAAISPERTYGHRVAPGIPQQGIVPPGSTSGWWGCRSRAAAGSCRWMSAVAARTRGPRPR